MKPLVRVLWSQWTLGWLYIADGLARVLTLGLWTPEFSVGLIVRRMKRWIAGGPLE